MRAVTSWLKAAFAETEPPPAHEGRGDELGNLDRRPRADRSVERLHGLLQVDRTASYAAAALALLRLQRNRRSAAAARSVPRRALPSRRSTKT